MTNQTSINYISALLERPETISEGDQSSVALFRQTFPYFVPVRYLIALEAHKKAEYTPQMLSAIQPYMGDWVLFCDFLEAGRRPPTERPATINKVADKKNMESPGVQAAPVVTPAPVPVAIPKEDIPVVNTTIESIPTEPAPAVTEAEVDPFAFAPVIAVVDEMPPIPVINPIKQEQPPVQPEVPAHHADELVPVPEPVIAAVQETFPEAPPEVAATVVPAIEELPKITEAVQHTPVIPAASTIATEEVTPPATDTQPIMAVEPQPEVIAEVTGAVQEEVPVVVAEVLPVADEPEAVVATYMPVTEEPYTEPHDTASVDLDIPAAEPTPVEVFKDAVEESAFARAWAEQEQHYVPAEATSEINDALEIVTDTDDNVAEALNDDKEHDQLIFPIYTKDYFLQQGEKISEEIPLEINELRDAGGLSEEDKSLMVVMSFSEWLLHFKNSAERQKEESKDQKALKTMWQKEKLAAAMEEENEEIPETVFEMAVNSISKEEGLVSETLAEIHIKQGKYDKAIEMYRKLSLRNPQKSVYFARKIEEALKDKQS